MNNPNPFVPKGSLLEQQSLRRSRLKITVGCVLSVSVCALIIMLIEGCKRETPDVSSTPTIDTNMPPLEMPSNPPPVETNFQPTMPPPAAPSNTMAMPVPQPMPQPVAQQAPIEPAAGSTYEVVAGDTLSKIATAHGVKLKALEEANPGVDPKKLKPKQKLNIPAPTAAVEATSATSTSAGATGAGGDTYVVKSGDTLDKIARNHGVKLKALRAANPKIATTDHIHVGDKLTIPAKTETATAPSAEPTPMPAPASAPTPLAPAPTPVH